jgi:hypothetical protein
VRRRIAATVAALAASVALAGCSGTEPGTETTAEADSTGGKPQIALTDRCYGECAYGTPLGLPSLALYADGRLVSVTRSGTTPVLTTRTLDRGELAALQRKAVAAGMISGGSSTLALAKAGFADGGGTVVTVRLRSTLTTLEVPLLRLDKPDSDSYAEPTRHRAVVELVKALREEAEDAEERVTAKAYVVHARTVSSSPGSKTWPGPPLAGMPDLGGGLRCGIVSGPQQQAVAGTVDSDAFGGTYTDGGRSWSVVGRALLPHEQTCGDVRETIESATASGPRFPGDRRT